MVFSAKNPGKSDKLALIEGKILNLMFFGINIPVVPIEIWLRVTQNQRQKTLKVASVLLFRHTLKTKSQPRPQGLLTFQYGGGRREDPGTQRTKTIADWCIP